MTRRRRPRIRDLILVLGDQLDAQHPAIVAGEPAHDRVLMIEARAEATHVPSHRQRIALFLSAMRHFAEALRARGWPVDYQDLEQDIPDLATGLRSAVEAWRPERVVVVEPGEWRVRVALERCCSDAGVPLVVQRDPHFFCSPAEFDSFAAGRKRLVMEHFYRHMRRRHRVLMNGDEPAGGRWNFDTSNRATFAREGPVGLPRPARAQPDALSRTVLAEVAREFPGHPGDLDSFAWPVTRRAALSALRSFVRDRLPGFGRHQDAMWGGEPFLYHSLLSSSLNLKLLNPREVIAAAVHAWREGHAPIESVEGFVRQILGWREFVRGVYWLHMPGYAKQNHYAHDRPLPGWFWTGQTDMACLSEVIGSTLHSGYAHHIQRLMVIGNFAVLAEVLPAAVCDWFLAVYVDAVEWVELPNTLGMALHADGGIVGTKPYVATGRYIQRMSNYCSSCRFDPGTRKGDNACPLTVLYWDFLRRHRQALGRNRRMGPILGHLDRMSGTELELLAHDARALRHRYAPRTQAGGAARPAPARG